MSRDDKVPLPKIPGRVYNTAYRDKFTLFGFSVFLIVPILMYPEIIRIEHVTNHGKMLFFTRDEIYVNTLKFSKSGVLYFFLISCFVYELFIKKRVLSVDVSETSVSAKFANNKTEINNDPLEFYTLQVDQIFLSRAYKYGASLVRVSKKKQMPLVLVDTIECPIKLKQWVESFQSQIAKPLPIIFSSPEIESDYNTGVYMSLKKKKSSAI